MNRAIILTLGFLLTSQLTNASQFVIQNEYKKDTCVIVKNARVEIHDTTTVSIEGTLTDEKTNSPIAFAIIKINNLNNSYETQSDTTGKFVLYNFEKGTYDFKIEYLGYLPTVCEKIKFNSGELRVVNFILINQTQELKKFETTDGCYGKPKK